ncbi:hypothetical protein HK405_002999 [Cladochytrium tenue]|nr:hypothetical protein HK405_002999 [Cladochytrium tenue]
MQGFVYKMRGLATNSTVENLERKLLKSASGNSIVRGLLTRQRLVVSIDLLVCEGAEQFKSKPATMAPEKLRLIESRLRTMHANVADMSRQLDEAKTRTDPQLWESTARATNSALQRISAAILQQNEAASFSSATPASKSPNLVRPALPTEGRAIRLTSTSDPGPLSASARRLQHTRRFGRHSPAAARALSLGRKPGPHPGDDQPPHYSASPSAAGALGDTGATSSATSNASATAMVTSMSPAFAAGALASIGRPPPSPAPARIASVPPMSAQHDSGIQAAVPIRSPVASPSTTAGAIRPFLPPSLANQTGRFSPVPLGQAANQTPPPSVASASVVAQPALTSSYASHPPTVFAAMFPAFPHQSSPLFRAPNPPLPPQLESSTRPAAAGLFSNPAAALANAHSAPLHLFGSADAAAAGARSSTVPNIVDGLVDVARLLSDLGADKNACEYKPQTEHPPQTDHPYAHAVDVEKEDYNEQHEEKDGEEKQQKQSHQQQQQQQQRQIMMNQSQEVNFDLSQFQTVRYPDVLSAQSNKSSYNVSDTPMLEQRRILATNK